MAPRRKRDQPYVSPYQEAQTLVVQKGTEPGSTFSRKSIETAKRILALEDDPRSALEVAKAPYRVFRWVVWGEDTPAARRARTDLALHLRATLATAYGGWPDERVLGAAWAFWQTTIAEALQQGWRPPACSRIPVADYQQAIASIARSKRRPPRVIANPRGPMVIELSAAEYAELVSLPPILLKELPALAALIKRLGSR
jgi:hypothetical protein